MPWGSTLSVFIAASLFSGVACSTSLGIDQSLADCIRQESAIFISLGSCHSSHAPRRPRSFATSRVLDQFDHSAKSILTYWKATLAESRLGTTLWLKISRGRVFDICATFMQAKSGFVFHTAYLCPSEPIRIRVSIMRMRWSGGVEGKQGSAGNNF